MTDDKQAPIAPADGPKLPPETAARAAEKAEKTPRGDKFVCVLTVRETGGTYKAGDIYKGDGMKNKDRLKHLLNRGAIREV